MKCWVAQYSWSTYELNTHADEYHNKLSVDKNLLHFSFPCYLPSGVRLFKFYTEDCNFAFKQQRMNKLSARQQFLLRSRRDSNYFILFMAISSAVSLNNISIAFPKQWNKVLPFEFVTKKNNINFKVSYLFLFFNYRITINSGSSKLRGTL